MTPKPFTEEQITVLRENPNTEYVSESVIKFTQEFKVKLVEGIKKGVPVRRIFQDAGYDYDMLGANRIKTLASRMRKEVREGNTPHTEYKERKRHPDLADYKGMKVSDQCSTADTLNDICIFSVQGNKSSTTASGSAANRSGTTVSR